MTLISATDARNLTNAAGPTASAQLDVINEAIKGMSAAGNSAHLHAFPERAAEQVKTEVIEKLQQSGYGVVRTDTNAGTQIRIAW